jgi:hypothetical protein
LVQKTYRKRPLERPRHRLYKNEFWRNGKPAVENDSSPEISSDNGSGEVYLATSKNLNFKRTMFPHYNIHKFT